MIPAKKSVWLLAVCLIAARSSVCLRADQFFVRGEFNADGAVDLSDPVSLLNYLFAETAPPSCFDSGDANDDGDLDLSDVVFTLNYLFLGGRAPSAPYPECGPDPTDDALDCLFLPSCPDVDPVASRIASASAPSNHYVEVRFEAPPGAAAEDPASFVITDSEARRLRVFHAEVTADRREVVLTTDGQLPEEYRLWQIGADVPPAPGGDGGGAAVNEYRVATRRRQYLQRHAPSQVSVLRLVDDAHAAASDLPDDPVGTDPVGEFPVSSL